MFRLAAAKKSMSSVCLSRHFYINILLILLDWFRMEQKSICISRFVIFIYLVARRAQKRHDLHTFWRRRIYWFIFVILKYFQCPDYSCNSMLCSYNS